MQVHNAAVSQRRNRGKNEAPQARLSISKELAPQKRRSGKTQFVPPEVGTRAGRQA